MKYFSISVTTKHRRSPLVFCAFDDCQNMPRRRVTHQVAHTATMGEDYMPFTHSVERWIAA